MGNYDKMSQTDFDDILTEMLEGMKASDLLSIPGIYEIVSEEFNNEVLDTWDATQEYIRGEIEKREEAIQNHESTKDRTLEKGE